MFKVHIRGTGEPKAKCNIPIKDLGKGAVRAEWRIKDHNPEIYCQECLDALR